MIKNRKTHILWVIEKADFIEDGEIYVFNAAKFLKNKMLNLPYYT